MNCCQKPDCEDFYCPGRVAKIGQRYPKHPECVKSNWRETLKSFTEFLLLGVAGLTLLVSLLYLVLRE